MAEEILDRIYRLLETDIGHNPHTLHRDVGVRALSERMVATGCETPQKYYDFLLLHPEEMQEFIEQIVVPETWFFRDRQSLDFTVDCCLEKWIHHKMPVRILCAPCSTGEEPYSLAMLFHERSIPTNQYLIEAVDISKKALLDASLAIYGKNSFRTKEMDFRDIYFMPVEGGYFLHPGIRKSVQLTYGNLCDPKFYEGRAPYHVIICRNLLIYLTPNAQRTLLQMFSKMLLKNGILILSPSETEIARKEGFIPVEHRKFCAFLRPGSPVAHPPDKKERKSLELKDLEDDKSEEKAKLLREAKTYADHGEFALALDNCFEILEKMGPDPEVFFLMGVIQLALNQDGEAEVYFLKTIELNPEHRKALVYLSLLADTKGEKGAAAEYKRRANRGSHES
jgi:chemotaxis protein methyltransferase WspC